VDYNTIVHDYPKIAVKAMCYHIFIVINTIIVKTVRCSFLAHPVVTEESPIYRSVE